MELPNNKIEAYLTGKLKGKELSEFKKQLKTDHQLAEEVKLQRQLIKQVESMGALKMKDQLLEIKEQLQNRRRRLIRNLIGLTAAAVFAGLILGSQFFGNTPPSSQELFAQHYQAYPLPFGDRAGGEEQLRQAGTFYLSSKYAQALPLLEQVLAENPDDSRSRLALAISQLELQQNAAAQQNLQLLIDREDPLYLDQALWYAALAALQQDQVATCRQHLIRLSGNPRAPHFEEAQALLKQLQK